MRTSVILVLLGACTVPPPFHVLETPQTLKAKQVSLLAGGGGGGGDRINGPIGGAAGRVRVGLGNDQEVGVDGDVVFTKDDVVGGVKLAYKKQLGEHVAIVTGPGFMFGGDTTQRNAAGADFGTIISTDVGGGVQIFTALRLTVAVPIRSDIYETGGVSEALVLPVGFAYPLGSSVHVVGELGAIGALTHARSMSVIETDSALGAYGALALSFTP